jgi:AraC-like DNA-binding protein
LGEDSSPWSWRHHDVRNDAVVIYPRTGELDAVSRPRFEAFAISVSEDLLDETTVAMGLPDFDTLTAAAEVMRCDHTAMVGLRTWLTAFCDAISGGAAPPASRLRSALESDLPRRLLATLREGRVSGGRSSARVRRIALERARAYIAERGKRRIGIGELARAAGVSERTLQYAFLERFGVSPNAYLRRLRLHYVRSELKRADPETTRVADVANNWGFWHMGQFAKDYQHIFGVLPSETLNKL